MGNVCLHALDWPAQCLGGERRAAMWQKLSEAQLSESAFFFLCLIEITKEAG